MAKAPDLILEHNSVLYPIYLADGVKSVQETSAEESTFNARFSRGKKKYGDDPLLTLAEFRNWTGGRGARNFEDDDTAFSDGLAWTLSPDMVVPAPRWQFATGLRSENRSMPGSVSWKSLVGANKYITVSFSASSGYSAAHIWLFVKRVGAPGNLVVSLCPGSSTAPGTPLKTVTKTIANITDYIDVYEDFAHASPQTLTSGATYTIMVSGESPSNADNHWDVGVDRTSIGSANSLNGITWSNSNYKLHYRVTDAHVSRKYIFQTYGGTVYCTSRPAAGSSSFYSFSSGAFTNISTTGLTIVSGRPVVAGGNMYFPQGAAVNIRKWTGSVWSDDGTNKATFLQNSHDANGAMVAKSVGSIVNIAPATGSPLVFGADIPCGDTTYPIENMVFHTNNLYVIKDDQIGLIAGNQYVLQESKFKNTPSSRNGAAAASCDGLLYISWLNSLTEIYGTSGNDIGQAWKGRAASGSRAGYFSCVLPINAWKFCSIDAGASGYSSVQVYNGMTWHEIYRAPYGHRIRDLWWEHVDGGHSRLLIDMDYDVVYLEFATDVAKPTIDPTHSYAHSFYIVSTTFDDGAARLSKYFKSLTASVTNCSAVEDVSVYFEVDYQFDNDVGEDGAGHWHLMGKIFTSPEGRLRINAGNKKCIRVRIRGYTDSSIVPPQLDAITLDGFTRTPARTVWTMRIKTGDRTIFRKNASNLLKFIQEASTAADDILIKNSIIPELNGRHVILTRPRISRESLNAQSSGWSGTMVLSMMDMSE